MVASNYCHGDAIYHKETRINPMKMLKEVCSEEFELECKETPD